MGRLRELTVALCVRRRNATDRWFSDHPEEAAEALALQREGFEVTKIHAALRELGYPILGDGPFRRWLKAHESA